MSLEFEKLCLCQLVCCLPLACLVPAPGALGLAIFSGAVFSLLSFGFARLTFDGGIGGLPIPPAIGLFVGERFSEVSSSISSTYCIFIYAVLGLSSGSSGFME